MSGGTKYDDNKPRMTLSPIGAYIGMSYGMTLGATKYSAYNWTKGISVSRLLDAAFRHLSLFTIGEDIDPDSGMDHLWHAMDSVAMAHDMLILHPELDDRNILTEAQRARLRLKMAQGARALETYKAKLAPKLEENREDLITEPYIADIRPSDLCTPGACPELTSTEVTAVKAPDTSVPYWISWVSATRMKCIRCLENFPTSDVMIQEHSQCRSAPRYAEAKSFSKP
jgi:hypothetical protein